jgi:hypothetical protein
LRFANTVLDDARRPDDLFKPLKVVADGHGEGEEFLEGLAGFPEFHGNVTRGEGDAGRQVGELLGQNPVRSFDEELRVFEAFAAEPVENRSHAAAAAAFELFVFTRSESPQVADENLAIRQTVRAHVVRDAGGEELLGAAAADAEDRFDGGAVDEGAGKSPEFGADVVDIAEPAG